MYKISVPVMVGNFPRCGGKEKYLEELKRIGAERVFFALGGMPANKEQEDYEINSIKENVKFFQDNGLEVGTWMWTYLYNGDREDFTPLKVSNGVEKKQHACPLCENYKKAVGERIMRIAECGVDMIMFDDDYRYGFMTGGYGILCTCDEHMKRIKEIIGEDITPEELQKKALTGGKNKYRSAWMKVNGDSLREFAENARMYLDKVNPDIRMGVCACMSTWDQDGFDPASVSRTLAGKTKPFLRLIGAPYWAVDKSWGNRLQNVIELSRMERSWCGEGIEIFCEGDAYPRPRTNCPAAFMELFDIAMRADGTTDGLLKYALDYNSTVDYERGYIDRHIKNAHIYEGIERIFSDKEAVGVRVYEHMKKLEDMVVPKVVEGSGKIEDLFFSPSSRMMADNSVPTTYYGEGVCGIAFGEDAKYVPVEVINNGMILDLRAAEIMEERGIDVGLVNRGELGRNVGEERFGIYKEQISVNNGHRIFDVKLKDGAQVQSRFSSETPASYVYENKDGGKFLVFCFDGHFGNESLRRSYARSRQINDAIKWMTGKKLPAYCYGNPDLYIMAKKGDDGSMAVGLWNIFADEVINPTVELDKEYKEISFVNCNGRIEGDKVILSDIAPFGFAGFEVR